MGNKTHSAAAMRGELRRFGGVQIRSMIDGMNTASIFDTAQ